jgi:hypothetical protein
LTVEYKDFTESEDGVNSMKRSIREGRFALTVGGNQFVAYDTLLLSPTTTTMTIVLEFLSDADATAVATDTSYAAMLQAELARQLSVDPSVISNLELKLNADSTVEVTFGYVANTDNQAQALNATRLLLDTLQNDPEVSFTIGDVMASSSLVNPPSTTKGPRTKAGSGELETWQIALIVIFSVIALLLGCCVFVYVFFRRLEDQEGKMRSGLQTESFEQSKKARAQSIRSKLQNEMEQEDLEAWWGSGSGGAMGGASNTTLWDEDGMAPADASVHVLDQNMNRGLANPHYFPKASNNEIDESQVWVKQSPGEMPTANFTARGPSVRSSHAPPRVASFKASLSLPRGQPHYYPSASPASPDTMMQTADDGWLNWDPDAESPQQSTTMHVDRQMELATLAALEPVPRPEFEDARNLERAQRASFTRGASVRSDGYLDDIVGDPVDVEFPVDEFHTVAAALGSGPAMTDEFAAATSALRALSPPSRPNLTSVRSQSRGTDLAAAAGDEFEFVSVAVVGRNETDWAGNPVPLGQRERRASTPPPQLSGTQNALPFLNGKIQFHHDDDGEPKVQQP